MNKDLFYLPYPWAHYSRKLADKISRPQFAGILDDRGGGQGVRLVIGREGTVSAGNVAALYWLVDESDGIIADIRYQVYGASALIGALEVASHLLLRKNYNQAKRMSADLIDKEVRDKPGVPAFPPEVYGHLNLVLTVIDHCVEPCSDLPCEEVYTTSPLHPDMTPGGIYPGFEEMSKAKKISVIEAVTEQEIRPYIELDAGGIEIVDLSEAYELTILYRGACTSCYAATGSTLSAIEQILQARVHPRLVVIPDLSNFA